MTKDVRCGCCGDWYNNYHHRDCPHCGIEDRKAKMEIRDRLNQAIVNLQHAKLRAMIYKK